MLITFSCDAYEDITMFGEVANRLLRMMGHSGVVPSALKAEEVLPALDRLRAALAQEEECFTDDEDISIKKRAFPLLQLLEHAGRKPCPVIWHTLRT